MVDLQYVFHRAHKLRALTGRDAPTPASSTASVRFFKRLANRLQVLDGPDYLTSPPTGQPSSFRIVHSARPSGAFPAGHRYQTVLHLSPSSLALLTRSQVAFCDSAQTRVPPSHSAVRIRSDR